MKHITKEWWKKCLNDKEKLEHWLVVLYNNEKDAEAELQKLHDKYIKKIDDLLAAKNKEIMTV